MKKFRMIWKQMLYVLNRQQKILCVLVFGATCIGSLLECLGVSVIIPVVNVILNPEQIRESYIIQQNTYLRSLNNNMLAMGIIIGVIAIYLIKNAFFIFLSWVRIKFSCKMQREIAIRMMRSYMSRGYQFFLGKNYGELQRGVLGDTTSINTVLYAGFRLMSDLLTIIMLCIFMFLTDWSLSLAMIIVSIVCVLFIYFVFRKKMYQVGKELRVYGARAGQAILQAFQGIKDVLVLRKQRYFVHEYEKNQIQVQVMQCKQTVGAESPAYIIEGVCVAGLMMMVGVKVVVGGEQNVTFIANLAAFALAAFRILPSLGRISISLNQVLTNMPSINAIYVDLTEAEKYAEEHPEVRFLLSEDFSSNPDSDYKCVDDEKREGEFKESIEIKGVSFAYNKEQDDIFNNLSLTIKKGESIAIIGESGAGKSTLIDILLGLLIPQVGMICMDGKPITENPELWARTIGYVPQAVFLSDDTILKNVAFGENDIDIDENRVWEAIERAELGDFIRTLPNGVNTFVGDRGVRLSGGQRQRIAIARALYHRPQILVLDEATSALDNDTESAIMSAIDSLQGQVTLIIVAHRLTTVKNCDVIYEVKKQKIQKKEKKEIFDN